MCVVVVRVLRARPEVRDPGRFACPHWVELRAVDPGTPGAGHPALTGVVVMVRPDDTRVELAEFLRDEVHQAKRDFPAVRVPSDAPTAWDRHHAKLNELLDDYEACPQ